jgi:hypothetical protein
MSYGSGQRLAIVRPNKGLRVFWTSTKHVDLSNHCIAAKLSSKSRNLNIRQGGFEFQLQTLAAFKCERSEATKQALSEAAGLFISDSSYHTSHLMSSPNASGLDKMCYVANWPRKMWRGMEIMLGRGLREAGGYQAFKPVSNQTKQKSLDNRAQESELKSRRTRRYRSTGSRSPSSQQGSKESKSDEAG